jgi:hypothetical protein
MQLMLAEFLLTHLIFVSINRIGVFFARACREYVQKNKEISEFADWCWRELTEYAVDAS